MKTITRSFTIDPEGAATMDGKTVDVVTLSTNGFMWTTIVEASGVRSVFHGRADIPSDLNAYLGGAADELGVDDTFANHARAVAARHGLAMTRDGDKVVITRADGEVFTVTGTRVVYHQYGRHIDTIMAHYDSWGDVSNWLELWAEAVR